MSASAAETRTLKALAHPLRVRILEHLRRHEPATAQELARRWRLPVGNVRYHVRRLQSLGLLERVRIAGSYGTMEDRYAIAPRAEKALRQVAERVGHRPEALRTSAHAVLDEPALAALRPDVQRLMARMKELEAQTLTRAGATGVSDPGLAVDLLVAVERGDGPPA